MAKKQQGIQSVEIGMRVLKTITASRDDMNLKTLASEAGISASTAHRYLVSLGRAGLIEQDPATGRYGLGVQALEMGLAALGRVDAIKVGTSALAEFRKLADVSSLLAVWGTHGATVIRWMEASQPVTVNVRVGSVMPLTTSATGRAFLAWRPNDSLVNKIVSAELAQRRKQRLPAIDVEKINSESRTHGLARVKGDLMREIFGIAVPLLDPEGHAQMVITAFGLSESFDADWNGKIASILRKVGEEATRRLGPPTHR